MLLLYILLKICSGPVKPIKSTGSLFRSSKVYFKLLKSILVKSFVMEIFSWSLFPLVLFLLVLMLLKPQFVFFFDRPLFLFVFKSFFQRRISKFSLFNYLLLIRGQYFFTSKIFIFMNFA